MKKTIALLIVTILSFSNTLFSQNNERNFNQILQTYYIEKDNMLLEHSIDFFNNINPDNKNLKHIIIGFFGGLFIDSPEIKNDFKNNIEKFQNENIKNMFTSLTNENIKTFMSKYPISPSFNDMNWAAFFSTGKTEYLDLIFNNCSEAENRTDFNLFLTGASAKWSLCSNSKQHEKVKEYLESNTTNREMAQEILNSDVSELKSNIVTIIKEQREKGIWND
ncbi:hypothetical protein [Lutibacter maritimus]|uniref:Uncharacterized protein n=1 Tax=Lutibacter maritimus TaxID=593133 RepID=A0A1I6NVJ8_9FLAO|nr:hypothetical protein [Lutibacter maritimus]SFS31992.1 hypothetical protein SAMN04488006_0628 [Lutibacter maritimus]